MQHSYKVEKTIGEGRKNPIKRKPKRLTFQSPININPQFAVILALFIHKANSVGYFSLILLKS